MIAKKVCLLGSFAVGKSSLIRRFVESIFSDKYHTTIGVKIDKKVVRSQDQDVQLMIWDIEGKDEFSTYRQSYLRGAAGYFLVVDGTRPDSVSVAKEWHDMVLQQGLKLPFILLVNKSDLFYDQRLNEDDLVELSSMGWEILLTSAKTGENVDYAFERLTTKLLENNE
ncbi:GTP-binding protein [Hahella sp. CCB-MM4]|uniref:Rab family GTPase n=1 Tax=Hahella sp. (strain CCB-MM4) TaxID=1926491 RepID=UPI000B9C5FB9|nr:Rab family GTPase [Hahella sp. CCB-MM4]OZG72860.1 GTP-binding protein [Hahella sp. CCB-MM4]